MDEHPASASTWLRWRWRLEVSGWKLASEEDSLGCTGGARRRHWRAQTGNGERQQQQQQAGGPASSQLPAGGEPRSRRQEEELFARLSAGRPLGTNSSEQVRWCRLGRPAAFKCHMSSACCRLWGPKLEAAPSGGEAPWARRSAQTSNCFEWPGEARKFNLRRNGQTVKREPNLGNKFAHHSTLAAKSLPTKGKPKPVIPVLLLLFSSAILLAGSSAPLAVAAYQLSNNLIANNSPPKFVTSLAGQASNSEIVVRVKEGSASIGKLIYTLKGEDPDEDPLTFGVLGSMASDLLRIENVPSNQANVYLRKELDRETTESYQVVITLTDGKLGRGNWVSLFVFAIAIAFAIAFAFVSSEQPPRSKESQLYQSTNRTPSALPNTICSKCVDHEVNAHNCKSRSTRPIGPLLSAPKSEISSIQSS